MNNKKTFIILMAFCGAFFSHMMGQTCGSFTSTDNSKPIKIQLYSEKGECFQVKMMNQAINPEFANNVTFFETDGLKKIVVTLKDGTEINKTLAINPEYVAANFKIAQNKKGKWAVKFQPFTTTTSGPTAEELRVKAEQDRVANVERIEREEKEAAEARERKKQERLAAEALEKKQEEERIAQEAQAKNQAKSSASSSSTSSTVSSTVSSGSSTGSTKVRLRVTTGGQPSGGVAIEIGYKRNMIGRGTTGSDGYVDIYTDQLITKRIDVYGSKGSNTWNLEGLITLDDNNYAEIDPAKAVEMLHDKYKEIENMDEKSDEEIMDDFGF